MATVAAYRRALERIYTLIGKEFALVVVAVNPEHSGSNSSARELLLVGRSISNEGSQVEGVRQVIRGPVVRYDLVTEGLEGSRPSGERDIAELKVQDIKAAFGGRTVPEGTPLVVALVGVNDSVLTRMSEGACIERPDLSMLITGGYLVLKYSAVETDPPMRLSFVDLCEKVPDPPKRVSRLSVLPMADPKFLVGVETIDATRVLTYAIRIQKVPVLPPRPVILPVAMPQMRVIRAPRWQPVPSIAAATAVPLTRSSRITPTGPVWEKLVQTVVERELSKIITTTTGREESVTIELGEGLRARIWPEMIHKIAGERDWLTVFTHQSVDPTPRANYESFETLGDKVLSLALVHYLFSTEDSSKILDSNGLTDSHKEILSEIRQPKMALNMGLEQVGLIRSTVTIEDKMLEDVYEAFFGCLFTVGNRLIEGGNQGLPLCEALFKEILGRTFPDLDPWSVPKDPQTVLNQIFIRLGWGQPNIRYNEQTRTTTIRLSRDAQSYLESMGPPLTEDKPLAVGPRSADKSAATRAAAALALSALKLGWGIDTRYVSIIVRTRLMKDERYAAVQREALKVANKMGYTDIYVARRAKNHNQLYAVIGVKPDDSETQLHIYKYESPEVRGSDPEEMKSLSTRVAAYITALRGFIASRE